MTDFTKFAIPNWWRVLLNRVQLKAPKALIGGGCLRDLYLNRPIADVDLFVPEGESGVREVVNLTHPKLTRYAYEPYFTHDQHVRQIGYFESAVLDVPPINLIHVSAHTCEPWTQIERFDFGLCQIAFDGEQLYMSSAFGRDVKQKTFTYTRNPDTEAQRTNSMARYERLSKKYEGWKLVMPTPKEELFCATVS